jgi:hypothetical protein
MLQAQLLVDAVCRDVSELYQSSRRVGFVEFRKIYLGAFEFNHEVNVQWIWHFSQQERRSHGLEHVDLFLVLRRILLWEDFSQVVLDVVHEVLTNVRTNRVDDNT